MPITIMGFIYIILLLYFAFYKNNSEIKIITTVLISSLLIDLGYVINIGGFMIDYYEFGIVFYIIYILFINRKKRTVNISELYFLLFFILFLISSFYYNFIFELSRNTLIKPTSVGFDDLAINRNLLTHPSFNQGNIKSIIGITFFLIFIVLSHKQIVSNIKYITDKIILFMKVEFLLIFTEFFINLINPNLSRNIINQLFGIRDSQVLEVSARFFYNAFGTFSEPSHIAFFLFVFFNIYFLYSSDHKAKRYLWLLLGFIIGILSGSTSAFFISFYGLFVGYIININFYKFIKLSVWILISILAFSFFYYYSVDFNQMVNWNFRRLIGFFTLENINGTSEVGRMGSIIQAYNAGIENPIFGVFIGSTNATGFIPTIFSNIGLLGSFLYLYLLKILFNLTFLKKFTLVIIYLILLNFIGQLNMIYSPVMIVLLLPFMDEKIINKEVRYEKNKYNYSNI